MLQGLCFTAWEHPSLLDEGEHAGVFVYSNCHPCETLHESSLKPIKIWKTNKWTEPSDLAVAFLLLRNNENMP